MTWTLVIVLAGGAYAFKVLGLVIVGDRQIPPVLDRCLALIPAALVPALVVKDTFTVGQQLQIDARAAGLAAAAFAAWRRAPLIAVIVVAAMVTAGVRALR